MILTCDKCRYTFSAQSLPERCPDCGAFAVRPATDEEIADYNRIQKEIAEEEA